MIIFVCIMIFCMFAVVFTTSCKRDDKLPSDVAYIKGRLDQLEQDVKNRDSILLQKIEESYQRIDDLSKIRKMTEKQIDSLSNVIENEKCKLKELKDNLLDW